MSRISSTTTKEENILTRTTETKESGLQDRLTDSEIVNLTCPAFAYMEHEVDETGELGNMSGSDLGKDYIARLTKSTEEIFRNLRKERK